MKVKYVFTSPKGAKVATLDDGRIIATNNSMYLYPCRKVESGYEVIGEGIISGYMMKNLEDFEECVSNLKEEEYNHSIGTNC